jgi:hypothetical protein
MSLIGSKVADADVADDVGGHWRPPLMVYRRTPHRKLPTLKRERGTADLAFNLQAKGGCPDHLGPIPPPFSLKPF